MKNDDIEKLFSSLEDFSKIPPDDLWQGIEEKLDYPEKKKKFPFWWSVAATLVVGLGLLATFYFNSNNPNTLIKVPLENKVVNQLRSIDSIEKDGIKNKMLPNKKILDSRISNSDKPKETSDIKIKEVKTAVATTNHHKKTQTKKENTTIIPNQTASVLANQTENNRLIKADKKLEKETFVQQNAITEQNKKAIEKTTPNPEIKENKAAIDLKENALAAIEKAQLTKDKKNAIEDKWSVQVFAGVNSSQNLKNQKTLGNTIESQRGYNYGVKTNYKLNRRWAVSTGLKISELGQQVANVSYVNSAKNLINISKAPFGASNEKGVLFSNPNYLFIPKRHNDKNTALAAETTFYQKGDLSQKVQYLEMPMEVSYAILNKGKARVNLNTGGFVGKAISNEVLLDNNSIGKNSEVNEVIFGTVLSSTLQYEFLKKTRVFVEPGMNYYSQPVQNQNFNQFQLILNFGLNVSF
ncbi:MAG TPA: outer membrane beta-barrel protein [Flavobacterium sp.]|nr:outer membrane beta-barrel protein [Flavobacterium sp.]